MERFGLYDGDAMAVGSQQAGMSSEDMQTRLQNLIADMEDDHKAVAGTTLPAFRQARTELEEAFNGLKRWCSEQGVSLGEAHQDAHGTDDQGQGEFRAMQGSVPSIKSI